MRALAFSLLALLGATAPGHAFVDEVTGLRLDLPAGFMVAPLYSPEAPPPAVAFTVGTLDPNLSRDLLGEICKVGFFPAPQRSALGQAEFNTVMGSDIILNGYRTGPVAGLKVLEASAFTQGDFVGNQLVVRYKVTSAYLTLVSNFETPLGRTTLSCSAPVEDFPAVRPLFETIRASLTPPT